MWLRLVVRVWFVVANAAALFYTVGVTVFYRFALTDFGIQVGVNQLGANMWEFFVPVIVALSMISATHVVVILCSVSLSRHLITGAILTCTRRLRVMRTSPSIVHVVPAALQVVGAGLTAGKRRTASFWSTYSAEITRLFMLWEVALQTFQAYKISYLVASVSINRLVALVTVTNCWFSPLRHYTMGNRPAAHVRLGRLLLDASLDLIYNVGIPLSIFYPYYRDANGSPDLYPLAFYYDDTWYVNALSELRQVFVTSWPDFVSKICGSVSLMYHLWKAQTALDDVVFKVANMGASDRETMDAILTTVDPPAMANLILSNCPQLHVPIAIQNLKYLAMIKIYNSTIASWDAQAALHQANHRQLQAIYLVRTNSSGIPEGLLADDLPRSLWDIEFYITNISTFPSAITKAWTHIGLVAFEMNPELDEFPQVLTTLPNLFTLILGMTNITTIPDGTYDNQALVSLGMHSSPIERLPDSVGSIDRLQVINFEGTKIATIPSSWMNIEVPVWGQSRSAVLFAGGSPLCESNEAQRVTKPTWLEISCDKHPREEYSYPIEQEDALRAVNQ